MSEPSTYKMIDYLKRTALQIGPVYAAIIGSLVLSLIAIDTSPAINRDGMLYVDAARAFLSGGLQSANAVFTWPFLPALMGITSALTGLSLQASGALLNTLFLAGACGLMVDCSRQKNPAAAWFTCLTILSLPGLNHYRDELLREYGCWFFVALAYWIAIQWSDHPKWSTALASQSALGVAALFRPEALALFPALTLWQLFSAPRKERIRRVLMISGIPLAFLALLVFLFFSGHLDPNQRLAGEFNRISVDRFSAKADALSSALIPYAQDNAGFILFFGSLSIIPIKFLKQLGIFVVPLLYLLSTMPFRSSLSRWQPFPWAFALHTIVLAIFALDMQFLSGRYVATLSLIAAPLIGHGNWLLAERFPAAKNLIIALAMVTMLANVISFSPKKSYYSEAGQWLAAYTLESPRVYVESAYVTHYAGWRLRRAKPQASRSELADALAKDKFDLVVLEKRKSDNQLTDWIRNNGLDEVIRFGQMEGTQIIFAKPAPHAE